MYIYNVTFNIDESLEAPWLEWMHQQCIPQMLSLDIFTNAKMLRVLVDEEMGGVTYTVQYDVKNKALLEEFYKQHLDAFVSKERSLFADGLLRFSTELQVLSEH